MIPELTLSLSDFAIVAQHPYPDDIAGLVKRVWKKGIAMGQKLPPYPIAHLKDALGISDIPEDLRQKLNKLYVANVAATNSWGGRYVTYNKIPLIKELRSSFEPTVGLLNAKQLIEQMFDNYTP